MKKYKKFLNLLLVSTMMLPGLALEASANVDTGVERLHGRTRVETSIEVSKEVYADNSTENVVLAGYHGEVDALTGTLLASLKNAPLLLVHRFDDSIKNELKRLGAKNVYLLGEKQVISQSLEQELKVAGLKVTRIAGRDRWETAVAVADESGRHKNHVFLTNDGRSGSLADALAVGPVSGRDKDPILLTSKDKLPEPTLYIMHKLGVEKVTIIGGTGVVSDTVQTELESHNIKVNRVAGDNRWETAEKIAGNYFTDSKKAILANDGRIGNFADALMGGYLGAKENAPILLTVPEQINKNTEDYLESNSLFTYVLGGESVITKENFNNIQKVIQENINEQKVIDARTAKKGTITTEVSEKNYTENKTAYEEKVAEVERAIDALDTIEAVEKYDIPAQFKDVKTNAQIEADRLTQATQAVEAVVKAEDNKKQADINIAKDLVLKLLEGEVKDSLENRLEVVQIEIAVPIKITNYKGSDQNLEIPKLIDKSFEDFEIDGILEENEVGIVEMIDAYAFAEKDLLSVTIPDSVREIGYYAFSENRFREVIIPNSVQTIGAYAFHRNLYLRSVKLPENLTKIEPYTFYNNRLTEIVIPNSVTEIGENAFQFNNLVSLKIPKSVTKIGRSAFSLNNLTALEIPDNVLEIEQGAFSNNNLTSLYLSDNLKEIGTYAFSNNKLEEVRIPKNMIKISQGLFEGNRLRAIEIPDNVTEIEYRAFKDNILIHLKVPENVKIGREILGSNNQFKEAYDKAGQSAGNYVGSQYGEWTRED